MRRADAIGNNIRRWGAILVVCAFTAGAARALDSKSNSFQNVVSDIDSSGQTMVAAAYSNQSSLGDVALTTHTSTSHLTRSGLMPIYEYPGTVTGFWASSGTAVGSVYLQWTAPGNDGYGANTKGARDFVIAYSTTASLSPASSQAAFNAALVAGGFLGSVTAPQIAGTLQSMTAVGLIPGVTYYFAIEAQESDEMYGNLSLGATAVANLGLTPITDLAASSDTVRGEVKLAWTAPTYLGTNPPVTYVAKISTTQMNTEADFLAATTTFAIPFNAGPAGSHQNFTLSGLSACTQYFFAIVGQDSGSPKAIGQWYRNAMSTVPFANYGNFATTAGCTKVPNVAVNISLSTGASSNVLGWSPVAFYNDGTAYQSSTAPTTAELIGYDVQVSTWPNAPATAWYDLATSTWASSVPTSVANTGAFTSPTFTDNSAWTAANCGFSPGCYYRVVGINAAGPSLPSNQRSTATNDLWAVYVQTAPIFESVSMDVPSSFASGLTGYYVSATPQWQDITPNGPVVASVEFDAMINGLVIDPTKRLNGAAILSFSYSLGSNGAVQVAGLHANSMGAQASASSPSLSLFWWDGNAWIQAYGKVSTQNQNVSVQTPFLGKYQLRLAALPGGFTFDPAGLTNRFITPNGDGKNDNAVFNFANPQFSNVTGKIFDIKGRYIADMTTPPGNCVGGPNTCLMWDGRANGTAVSGGVYIYQLSGENQHFNGTIVVIK